MPTMKYIPRCQWCGKTGASAQSSNGAPRQTPKVPGKCQSHPSGKPNMPHSPQWEPRG